MSVCPAWAMASPVGFALLDAEGKCLLANPALCAFLGVSTEALLGTPFHACLPSVDVACWTEEWRRLLVGLPSSLRAERAFVRQDGGTVWGEVISTASSTRHSVIIQILDVTERKVREGELRETQARLAKASRRMLLSAESAGIGFWEYDVVADRADWDDGMLRIYGIQREEFTERWESYVHPEDLDAARMLMREAVLSGTNCRQEFRILRPDGESRHIRSLFTCTRDAQGNPLHMGGINEDITNQKRAALSLREALQNEKTLRDQAESAAERIRESLAEKNILLKEIHHRVKNNLQIISSLLAMQSRKLKDPGALKIFMECRERIQFMARLHSQIYASDNVSRIDIGKSLEETARLIMLTQAPEGCAISVHSRLASLELDIDTAQVLGLIATELIMNSLKHAFNDRLFGTLTLELRDGERRAMTVGDDGIGLPDARGLEHHAHMGLNLVQSLARQIGGTCQVASGPPAGTRITIYF